MALSLTAHSNSVAAGISSSRWGLFSWQNCTVEFAQTDNSILSTGGELRWTDTPTAIVGAVIPNFLLDSAAAVVPLFFLEGVDCSAIGSGKTFVKGTANHSVTIVKDCKIGASATITNGPTAPVGRIDLIRVDSSANKLPDGAISLRRHADDRDDHRAGRAARRTEQHRSPGKWSQRPHPEWQTPFECFPISIFNRTVGVPVTVTVQGIWGGGAVPLTDEIWMEVEYLGSALNPQGSFVTTTKADILAAGANVSAGSGTWGGSTTPFALTGTVTPQMEGPIWVTVKVAKV